MILVKIMGGHSNQMFQYATGRRLALKHNTQLQLDLSWFENIPEGDTPRVFEMDVYPIEATIGDMSQLIIRDPSIKPSLVERAKHRAGVDKRIWPLGEQGASFNPRVLNAANNTQLIGFWQCEKYFIDIRNQLLKDFEPIEPMSKKNRGIVDHIKATESIWMHVRRGDYVTNKDANAHHGLTGLDYYQKALDILVKKLPGSKLKNLAIFVCSNDIPWCKKNFRFPYPITYIENTLGSDDMRMTKHCKHDILANSSFSWWGAWLNQNPEKIVIAPEMWFQDPKANREADIVPESWIRL